MQDRGAGLKQSRAAPYQCSQNRVSLRGLCLYPGLFFYDQEAEVPYRRPLTLSLSPFGDVSSHSPQTVDPLRAVRVTWFFLCETPAQAGCPRYFNSTMSSSPSPVFCTPIVQIIACMGRGHLHPHGTTIINCINQLWQPAQAHRRTLSGEP